MSNCRKRALKSQMANRFTGWVPKPRSPQPTKTKVKFYSTYTVNLIPLGGYAISIVSNVLLNAASDWKKWRIQVAIGPAVSVYTSSRTIILTEGTLDPSNTLLRCAFGMAQLDTNDNGFLFLDFCHSSMGVCCPEHSYREPSTWTNSPLL